MRGHIRKRGSNWVVVVELGRDRDTGKRRQRWHSGFKTRKDAERQLAEIVTQLERGTYVAPSKENLESFLRGWLASSKSTLRPNSWAAYESAVRLHVIPRIGHVRLQEVSPGLLNSLYAGLLTGGDMRRKNGGGLSPTTVGFVHTVLGRAMKDAVRWGHLSRNPAALSSPPRKERPQLAAWSSEEARTFLRAAAADLLQPVWYLALATGMRRSELLGLRWVDVDLAASQLSVTQVLTSFGGKATVRLGPPKTTSSRRRIALDADTVGVLRRHSLRSVPNDRDLVFTESDGSPIYPQNLSQRFEAAVRRAGVRPIRFHDLRHTHATLALQAGINPKVVQERLGHSSIAMTLDVYSHVTPSMQEEAAERIGALISV